MYSVNAYVAADLAELRLVFANDDPSFAAAIAAIAQALARALVTPDSCGIALGHGLAPWRRSAFPSRVGGETDLRLIFRARDPRGLDLLAFGVWFAADTTSVYRVVRKRLDR
ncbi:MAG: hypothetical protein ACREM2_09090 [Vulcanimicrobiaceae bacterium]